MNRFSIQGLKFLLAGKGMRLSTGKYLFESVLVGAFTGLVVVVFRRMIDFVDDRVLERLACRSSQSRLVDGELFAPVSSLADALEPHRLLLVVLPAVGAVLGHLLISRFTKLEHARGTGSAIRAYHQRDGYVTSMVLPVKSVASVLTVGFGGSAGYEGPVTLIGASCGSLLSRLMNLTVRARRILMAAGLAAGIAALFQAPLAGAIFGFEIFYSSSDVEHETVLPSFVAAAVSYTIYAYFYGWEPLFGMPPCTYENGLRLLPYFVLAVVVAFGARFYIHAFRFAESRFSRLNAPGWVRVAAGGLLTGVFGYFLPDVLGPSYSVIRATFAAGDCASFPDIGPVAATGFVVFFFVKTVATACTVGSGGSGGVFAPALVCGGALGAATGLVFARWLPAGFDIHPAAFALVGMAGFLAAAIRIPLTAIVMVAEISGNHSLLLPAMWVCGIAFWLDNGWSLYRSQVHSRESSPVHLGA